MRKMINVFTIFMMPLMCVLLLIHNAYGLQVSFVVGEAFVERNGKQLTATVGMNVDTGDTIITKKASIVELLFLDGSAVKIFENAKVKIARVQEKEENISVVNGVVKAKIAKLQKNESKKIYTPTTVCAIRGTEFFVAVSDSSNSRINMEEGSLELINPYGALTIQGDEQANAEIAKKAEADENLKNPEAWKNTEDKNFTIEPQKYADSYEEYLQTLEERSSTQSAEIAKLKKMPIKKNYSDKIEQDMQEVEEKAAMIADDYFLGDCASAAVETVLQNYKDKKQEIYDAFDKIKSQADRVLQQQKANYEAIMAVKEAYRKSYEEIKGKHKQSIEQIKEEVKKVQEQ
ncbi:MAG TPA: FecR family protein [Spirochaetota bacterium]|nr:FecR family protein [Spirochaetota bacterium]HOM86864.1 FecR family protein [Spirochaetota bacterium]HOR93539.1 FecR family protein [Spirochaetota bacterium]HOT18575.1 FecR family protein [Spirochaetota bacterium]HPD04480.1 FecR family protein [Spirochaetota bacterium]